MSADDFQSKCASVMDTMIKSAISETTKLFETMVNELKTEISKIKKENELLKIRCSNYEKTSSQVTVKSRERAPSDGSGKRDSAVQCDLFPYCTLLMEHHQPSLKSQEEQCCSEVMEDNRAKDQCCGTHEDGNPGMTYVHVKSEEETEDTSLARQVISYNADSLPTSAETEVPLSDQDCSDGEMKMDGDSQLAMELPCLEMDIAGQGAQDQLSEPEKSVAASVSAMDKDMEEDACLGLKISEIRTYGEVLTTEEKHFVQYTGVHPSEEQPKPSTPDEEDYCEEFQRDMTHSAISLGRGQPSIKVPEDVPADQEVNACPSIRMGQAEAFAEVDEVNITSSEVSHELRENNTAVTLQDAMLLVQAMNQTKADDTIYTHQIDAPPQTQFVCNEVSPQSDQPSVEVSTLPVPSQTPPLPTLKDDLPIATPCTTQSTASTLCGTSLKTDTPKINTSHSHIKVVTLSSTTTSTSSTPVMSGSLKIPHINSVPNTIIVVPRSLSSVTPHSISPLSPTQISTVVSKVAAAKNIASLPASSAMGLLKPSFSSVRQKTTNVTASKSAATTVGLTDEQSGIQQCPKITIVVSRQMLARARKRQAQTKLSTTTSELSEDTTQEEPSSVDISTHSTNTILSMSEVPAQVTPVNASLKETSVSRTLNSSQMSGKSSETLLEEAECSSRLKALAPFTESVPVPVKSTLANDTPEVLAKSHASRERTCKLDEEKHSDAAIQLSSITSTDLADPRSQMSKKQFLAQLAVSPVVQAQQQSSTHEAPDAPLSCAETSMCNKKERNSLVERLRGHLKYHLQRRGTKTKQEPVEEAEISDITSKKPRLENVCPNERETTSEPIHVHAKKASVSLQRITNTTPRMKSGICEDDIGLKKTVDKPKATNVSPRQLRTTKDSSSTKANSPHLDSRILRSRKISLRPQNSKATPVTPLKTRLSVEIAGSNMSQTSSPRSFTSPKDVTYPVNINLTSVSPRSSRSKKSPGSKKWNACSGSHRNVDSSEKVSKSEDNSPKISTIESISVGIIEDFSCTRRSSRASKFLAVKNGFPCTKLVKDHACQRQAGESKPAKKFRLLQDCAIPKRNASVMNAKKLAKAAKAKTIEKIKRSKLQSEASATCLAMDATSCEVVKRCKAKAVWTPPKVTASKMNSLGGKKSSLLAVKNNSPTSLYSASVSLHTIPVRTTKIISPLQPLSVIGRHLLKNQCGECGRVLSSSASLESHVSLHTGHRPFSCTLCGKSFPDSKGLKRHGRVHRNGRIHICQQCGKGFVYRFGLTKHIQMVHGRIKPFVCQMCSKAFFTKRDVEAHIRIHTGEKPFPCHLCEKRFARRVELNVHLRWHNGEKRHWCPYCGKGFLDFNNLKRHKYIHTGEKPHSCPHCPKHFTQSGHLKKHLKNVHKIH